MTPIQDKTVYLICLIAAFLISSCAGSQFVPREVYQGNGFSVKLAAKKDASGEVVRQGFDHPWEVDRETLAALLSSVRYQKGIAFFNEAPLAAFPPEIADRLLPQLQKAFAAAGPDEYVAFSFVFTRNITVFKKEYMTDGLFFRQGGTMNCAFQNMAFDMSLADMKNTYTPIKDSSYEPFTRDPTAEPVPANWRIIPGRGQTLARVENPGFMGEERFKNWVKLDISVLAAVAGTAGTAGSEAQEASDRPAEKGRSGGGEKDTGQVFKKGEAEEVQGGKALPRSEEKKRDPASIEQNLEFLEELYAEGLISQMAYLKKKEKLLEALDALQK